MRKVTLVALVLVAVFAFAQKEKSAPQTDPWAGTWKFDAAQSKLNSPAPREATITSYSTGADHMTVRYDVRGVGADGTATNQSYAGKADGKAYPLMLNGQEVAKISYHRDSDHQYSSQSIGADGSTGTGVITLSQDGKTVTIKEHVKTKVGEFDQVEVYHKQ